MKALFFFVIGVGVIVFQTAFSDYFQIWTGGRPDAMLLATLYMGIYRGSEAGLIGGFFLGLIQDVLSGGLIGANAFSKGLIGYATGGLGKKIASRGLLFKAGVGLFATLFDVFLAAGLALIFLPDIPLTADYWWAGGKTTALNTLLAPLAVDLLGRAQARIFPEEGAFPYPTRL